MRYENYASQWPIDMANGARCDCPDQSACAMMLHGQPAASNINSVLNTAVNQAANRAFSYIYVTDDVMPNPWDKLASYFGTLMDIVAPVSLGAAPLPCPCRTLP